MVQSNGGKLCLARRREKKRTRKENDGSGRKKKKWHKKLYVGRGGREQEAQGELVKFTCDILLTLKKTGSTPRKGAVLKPCLWVTIGAKGCKNCGHNVHPTSGWETYQRAGHIKIYSSHRGEGENPTTGNGKGDLWGKA